MTAAVLILVKFLRRFSANSIIFLVVLADPCEDLLKP